MNAREPVVPLTAEEINALPERVRHYIMWLETETDPAGIVQNNYRLTQENLALRKLLEQEFNVVPPKMYVTSNPSGPSWVKQRFLDHPPRCGTCNQIIDPNPWTGTSCACTPPSVVRNGRFGKLSDPWNNLPQSVMQTQRSHNEWPGLTVDNPRIKQLMYRAEADFHKASKGFLTKREQGHVMGMFRSVLSAFGNALAATGE